MSQQLLKEQVERIIDEGEGARRSVIVQMESDEDVQRTLVTVAADVHRRRNLSLSARDVLPAEYKTLQRVSQNAGGKKTPAVKRDLLSADASLAMQVGAALIPVGHEVLRRTGYGFLSPLLVQPFNEAYGRRGAARLP